MKIPVGGGSFIEPDEGPRNTPFHKRIEIGRELKVSELKPKTIVVVEKADVGCITWWVKGVTGDIVHLYAGVIGLNLLLLRTGPDLERVTDDTGAHLTIYEYLGELGEP